MSDPDDPGAATEVGWHFRPVAGLFGDPKPVHWKGVTHVFFQNSPGAGGFEGMRWAHAASRDLVHWERLPDALVPEPDGCDAYGCWTGSVVRVGNGFQLFYTGVGGSDGRRQTVCRAFSDDLVRWRRDPANPLLLPAAPFATGPHAAWRDPQVVLADDGYHLLLTADLAGAPAAMRGVLAHFHSVDLERFEPRGVLYYPGDVHRCECPDLVRAGDREVLLYSDFGVQIRERRPDGRFRAADPPQLDDFRFYAAKTAVAKDRRLMFAFLFGRRAPAGPPSDSSPWEWGGVMALPREVEVASDGSLRVRPVAELAALRREPLVTEPEAAAGHGRWVEDASGFRSLETDGDLPGAAEVAYGLLGRLPRQAELDVEVGLDAGSAGRFGLLVGCDRSLTRGYALEVDLTRGWLTLRRLLPETNPADLGLQRVALPARRHGDRLRLRVFLDHTVLEAFADDRVSLSGRLYDVTDDHDRWWGALSRDGRLTFRASRAWRLALDP